MVDFEKVIAWKMPILQKAAQNFARQIQSLPIAARQFEGFCRGNAAWLDNYVLFMALLDTQGTGTWTQWPQELRRRYPDVLNQARHDLQQEIFFYQFLQYEFFEQWFALKRYANVSGVQIVGDIPIYVSQNSADVWSHPEVFKLDPNTGEALEVAGVPPDYFSATGQLWGNPIYNWEYLESTNFDWWVRRVQGVLYIVDVIRIDHFRGLESYWSVPAGEETAINGRWVKCPGAALFDAILSRLGSLPIIAEDLGDIDQAVLDLRDRYGFPGMKILHFGFGSDSGNPYLPFNASPNSVIYTGTHDNNTTIGWYYENLSDYHKDRFHEYIGCVSHYGISWDVIRQALSSVANQAIIPLQDIFSLGSDARMNTPGKAEGNWSWRYRGEALTPEYSARLANLTTLFGRAN
jgi:4-alpha-glucanotransferase